MKLLKKIIHFLIEINNIQNIKLIKKIIIKLIIIKKIIIKLILLIKQNYMRKNNNTNPIFKNINKMIYKINNYINKITYSTIQKIFKI